MKFPIELAPRIQQLATQLSVCPEDIEEHFIRGSGAGGQKINKTSNCVELKHIPTGITVRMQKHREQNANRLSAYKLLLLKIEEEKQGKTSALAQKRFKIRKQKQRRSRKSKERMLEAKHHRSEIKDSRKKILN